MSSDTYQLKPIGRINADRGEFFLEIDQAYRSALDGLQDFGHVMVFWWNHLCDDQDSRGICVVEQPYKKSPQEVGIFATRSPVRPNPISLTAAAIISLEKESGIIRIPFIDAENDSPLIDLKPYHPSLDRIREVKVPKWCDHWPKYYEDSATFDWEAEFVNAR